MAVKVTQKNGWCLENPKFSEISSVQKAKTSRQKNAALNQAKVQVEAMSSLLLQSTGMQATLSENCIPPQLLKKDGKSLHFSKNLTSPHGYSTISMQHLLTKKSLMHTVVVIGTFHV